MGTKRLTLKLSPEQLAVALAPLNVSSNEKVLI